MTSVNTPEEQAIAFLLTCVENSQKGKINWDNVSLDIGVNMTPEAARKYYFSIVKNAKEFERSDKYPELPGDPSWQSITADDAEIPIIIVEGRNDIID
ncbi:hypothetical protein N7489_009970 [Penicillium chrysogenum]|uniref:Myb-like DNA-binding domain-containing protein n=2 Tax=Penicillium TaxID=5073 RepID=A0A9W9WDT7_9EURO|nr:uncharacterized protein N7489_009970 [Penicillium chrysogenum]XP_061069966.1 uncharacterized protein N7525_004180 [Penicillium rubens]KAJ5456288.1 hypothetical protein N7530_011562 [Penicillium desertorum]KAJ5229262.1 hypothetical protein N7489_009970 [Penicillium chrysogenum]KAJ5258666.1 hypothetical protein N7524_010222 [Penicillium chrysogenum]KAJ5282858.1 hypothetical protein N7505_000838 [Penicillium chrysogenum]KAJ5838992.1 hypothetical protein N7525_004180 [Penicillium rubens]